MKGGLRRAKDDERRMMDEGVLQHVVIRLIMVWRAKGVPMLSGDSRLLTLL
jgi:hypothetical protein